LIKEKIWLFTLILTFSTAINASWVAKISEGEKEFSLVIPESSLSPEDPLAVRVISINELNHHWIAAASFSGPEQKLIFYLIDMSVASNEGDLDFATVPNRETHYKFSLSDITVDLWYNSSSEGKPEP